MIQRISVVAVVALLCGAGRAYAADPNHDYSSVPSVNATTQAELRQWAEYFWHYDETGEWPSEAEGFEFTHPEQMPPGFVHFGAAYDLFTDLYIDQLDLDPWSETRYSIFQLIDDDPEVLAQFKHYTITGELIMGVTSDPDARIRHALAAIDALLDEGKYTIGELVYMDELVVLTVDLKKRKPGDSDGPTVDPVDPIDPETLPPGVRNFHHWLEQYRERLKVVDPYIPMYRDDDYEKMVPGFDCDDFADALAQWLKRRFPGGLFESLWINWGEGDDRTGHVIIIIKKDGYYWLLDPQTGKLLGPFPEGTPIDVRPIMNPSGPDGYGVPGDIDDFDLWGPFDPGYRPKKEPKPWWHNPDMRDLFEEMFDEQEWWWYAPDGAPDQVGVVIQGGYDPEILDPQPDFVLVN